MPPRCYICKFYNPKKVSLFRIPDRNDEYSERGGLWLKLLEEKQENIHKIRICSEHFLKKKPAKSGDHLDIDWVPNKNLGQFSKNRKIIDYYYRSKKKSPPEEYLNRLKINDYREPSSSSSIKSNTISQSNAISKNSLNVISGSDSEYVAESSTKFCSNANSSNLISGSGSDYVIENATPTNSNAKSLKSISGSGSDYVVESATPTSSATGTAYVHEFSIATSSKESNLKLISGSGSDYVVDSSTTTSSSTNSFNLITGTGTDYVRECSIASCSNAKSLNWTSGSSSDYVVESSTTISSNTNSLNMIGKTGTDFVRECSIVTSSKANSLNLVSDPNTGYGSDFFMHTNDRSTNFSEEFSELNTKVICENNNTLIPLKKRRIHIIEEHFFRAKDIQTDLTSDDIDMLFEYYQEAVNERNLLLLKISTLVIDVDFLKGNNKKTRFYTGLTTWSLLKNLYEMIEPYLPTHFNCKLSKFQMLALTLMKLRLNFSFTDLGYRFQVEVSTASKYFHRCIFILFKLFDKSKLMHWPTEKYLLRNTPSYFRSTFKDRITVIVDCFEIFIERSSVLKALAQAFSFYKHHTTLKYLIGISTTGAIIFVSRGFGGRASDKKVTVESKFLDKLKDGDLILADKGFLIEDEVKAVNASLALPCFVRNGKQLEPHEVEQSRYYASIRIHVERLISVVRQKFNICSDIAQMSSVSKQNDLFDYDLYDKIVFICCCLVNICPSVVSTDFEI